MNWLSGPSMFDVILLQGPSGSGKSRVADMMKNAAIDGGWITSVLSADHFFRDEDGNYNFDPRKLSRAHMEVVAKAFRFMHYASASNEMHRLIIDNTNMALWEWDAVYVMAQELGATRIVLQRANILEEVPNMSYEEKEILARTLHIRQTKSMEDYLPILGQLLKYEHIIPNFVEVRTFETGL